MHDCFVMKLANHPADRLPGNVIRRIDSTRDASEYVPSRNSVNKLPE